MLFYIAWAFAFSNVGTTPNCCISPSASHTTHPSAMRPREIRWITMPSTWIDLSVGGIPRKSPVCATRSESCGDELIRLSHVLNDELKIGECVAIQCDRLLDAFRSRPEIRACRIVVDVIGGKDFIRDRRLPIIPEFQENPQNRPLIFRGHRFPPLAEDCSTFR